MLSVVRVGGVKACGIQAFVSVDDIFSFARHFFHSFRLCVFHTQKFGSCGVLHGCRSCDGIRVVYPFSHKRLEDGVGIFADVRF